MSQADDRLLARMLLVFMADLAGIPQTFRELADYAAKRLRRPCDGEVQMILSRLETYDYLARCEAQAADLPLYKITASGLRQALKQVPPDQLDTSIWG
jgi:hypothetical protein